MPRTSPLRVEILGVPGLRETRPGDDLAEALLRALEGANLPLEDGDVLVVAQKIVSKAEGRLVSGRDIDPSPLARELARAWGKEAAAIEAALREARRVVKMDRGVLVTETRHGFVCANSGVDASNLEAEDTLALLPVDPDASAARLRESLEGATGKRLAVLIADTFGRPWREGATNVAIGISGMEPLEDYRGEVDARGRELTSTVIAVADEIAAAAELVMGKLDRVPVAIVRGFPFSPAAGSVKPLLRAADRDLFR